MSKIAIVIAAALLVSAGAWADETLQPMQPVVQPQVDVPDFQHCLHATGSHMRGDDCVSADGRVYTQEDMYETGGVNWVSTLARDPSITMSHGR